MKPTFTIPLIAALLALAACSAPPRQAQPAGAAAPTPAPAPTAPAASSKAKTDAARQAEFDRSMAKWHGAKLDELLAKLGKPSSRSRPTSGEWVYTYAKTASIRGPAGVEAFSCVVSYRVDPQSQRVVGHRIQGC